MSSGTGVLQIYLSVSSWSKHNIEHHQMHDVVSLHPCSSALRLFRCASFVSGLSVTALWTPSHHLCPSYSPFLPSAWLQRRLQDPHLPAVPWPGKRDPLLGNLLHQPPLIQLIEQNEACSSVGKWRGPALEPWGIPVSLTVTVHTRGQMIYRFCWLIDSDISFCYSSILVKRTVIV